MSGWRLLAALASGLLLALAFPNHNLSALAWVALAPLLAASLGARPRVGFLCGFLHGVVFFGLTLSWIYTFLRGFGRLSVAEAAAVWTLLVAARSCFPGSFALGLAYLSRSSRWRVLVCAPFLWVATELAVARLPHINFIWNLLGYSVAGHVALVQMAAWTGIYGLASVVVAYNAMVVWLLEGRSRRAVIAWGGTTAALFGVLFVAPRFVPSEPGRYRARLVQTNLPVLVSYPQNWLEAHAAEMAELERLSAGDPASPPVLVVWPEVPAPFSLEDSWFAGFAARTARESRGDFLVGVDEWRPGPQGAVVPHNSAALLDASGRVVLLYDKMKLVPFGEYVPWRRWLTFARPLIGQIGDYEPGSSYKVGNLPGGKFSVFICYEAIFPEQVRGFVAGGAELLVNISDDGWYGHSAALAQHLAMARVRAVENRRWLLRDTNTGYTVAIDPYGRVVARLAANTRGTLEAPYDFRSDRTVYAHWGDWWGWLCAAASAGFLLLGRAEKARGKR